MAINPVTIKLAILALGITHRGWVVYQNYKRIRRMMNASSFRPLSDIEEAEFRAWARDNYTPFDAISEVWHPVVQEECAKMNIEALAEQEVADGSEETTA